jgi:hypothetical protein
MYREVDTAKNTGHCYLSAICERGMRKVMKRARKEREVGMKEESKGNQLTRSYCTAVLLSIIKISKRIISKDWGRNTD